MVAASDGIEGVGSDGGRGGGLGREGRGRSDVYAV